MNPHFDLEKIKLVALHDAKNHRCNYNIILLNPNEEGEFDFLVGSTYEYVTDSYFEKDRPNAKILFKTDDLLSDEIEDSILPQYKPAFFEITNPYQGLKHLADFGQNMMHESPPQYIRESPKVGRNELCTCKSGKKAKRCCFS